MTIFDWLGEDFANRDSALKHRARKMVMAKTPNRYPAIGDYTSAIGMPDPPLVLKAMFAVNRAMAYMAGEDPSKTIECPCFALATTTTRAINTEPK